MNHEFKIKNRIVLFLVLTITTEIFLLVNATLVKIYLSYDKIIYKLSNSSVAWHQQLLKFIPEKSIFSKYTDMFRWYHVQKLSNVIYYINHLGFLLILICFLILFKKKILIFLDKAIIWKNINNNQKARGIIFYSVLFLIFCFVTKSHLVVFFGGISGWDYEDLRPSISKNLVIESKELACKDYFSFALKSENVNYQKENGYLEDIGIFLHFGNGQVLPVNLGILNMVFPYIQYPILNENLKLDQMKSCLFIKHIKYGLDEIKSKQSSVFYKFRYPNHTPYQEINYLNYPKSSNLVGISVFNIIIQIYENEIEIIGGKEIMFITC